MCNKGSKHFGFEQLRRLAGGILHVFSPGLRPLFFVRATSGSPDGSVYTPGYTFTV